MSTIARWILAAIGLAATCGAAWALMTARVSATEARLDVAEADIRTIKEDTRRGGWMLYRICEAVSAHPCLPPPERP